LNSILGFTRIMLGRSEEFPERHQQNLTQVNLGGEYLLSLVGDILDLTSIEDGKVEIHREPFDLAAMVHSCSATIGPLLEEAVTLKVDVPDDIGLVNGDSRRLRQVLINMLGYAAKSTKAGEIGVRARVGSAEAGGQGEDILLSVSNTGI
jgi:signal transduction histidine kinase